MPETEIGGKQAVPADAGNGSGKMGDARSGSRGVTASLRRKRSELSVSGDRCYHTPAGAFRPVGIMHENRRQNLVENVRPRTCLTAGQALTIMGV